jgi:hypothetical protein
MCFVVKATGIFRLFRLLHSVRDLRLQAGLSAPPLAVGLDPITYSHQTISALVGFSLMETPLLGKLRCEISEMCEQRC